jgi:hypothetical protein
MLSICCAMPRNVTVCYFYKKAENKKFSEILRV